MERRTFLAHLGQTLVAVPLVGIVSGCGGDDTAAPQNPATADNFDTESNADATGHTHNLNLTCTDLKGGTVTYLSSIVQGHPHNVTLTFDQVTRILNGESVGPITSSNNSGHTHTWTLQKPANACT